MTDAPQKSPTTKILALLMLALGVGIVAVNYESCKEWLGIGQGEGLQAGSWLFSPLGEGGADSITQIDLKVGEDSLSLIRDEGFWRIKHNRAKVNKEKIDEFVASIAAAKRPEKPVINEESQLAEYGLDNGSKIATFAVLHAGDAKCAFVATKDRMRMDGETLVYNLDGLSCPATVEHWLTPSISLINGNTKEEVFQLDFHDFQYRVTNRGKLQNGNSRWALEADGKPYEGNNARVYLVLNYLESIPVAGVMALDEDAPAMRGHGARCNGGRDYKFWIEEVEPGDQYGKIAIKPGKEEPIYLISASHARFLSPGMEELKEQVKAVEGEPDTGEPVTLGSDAAGFEAIVIGWEGADILANRTRAEAISFAQTILVDIQGGADFRTMATTHSDWRSMKNGEAQTNLEEWPRSMGDLSELLKEAKKLDVGGVQLFAEAAALFIVRRSN